MKRLFSICLGILLSGAVFGLTAEEELAGWKKRQETLAAELSLLQKKFSSLNRQVKELSSRYYDIATVCEGRLTTETGVPLSVSDRTSQSTLYFTPYKGSSVSLFNGAIWKIYSFTERSIALSGLTSGKNYDVFLYNNSGTPALELSAAWSTDTSRTDALSAQDGVLMKASDNTRRYLGTFRATASNTTEDSRARRFLWNYFHRLKKNLLVNEGTDSWSYSANTWRQANGGATNQVEFVIGESDVLVTARALGIIQASSGTLNYYATGIGVDSTTVNSATLIGGGTDSTVVNQIWAQYHGFPGVGYHSLTWLERGEGTTGISVWGDNGDSSARYQSGLMAQLEG